MAKLKFIRTKQLSDRLREITVYLDGKKLGNISNGETKEYDISSGQHILYAKIDWFWCRSRDLTLTINETGAKTITIAPYKYADHLTSFCIFLTILHIILDNELKPKLDYIVGILIIPIFLIIIYYLTFGRKDYITLKETI